MHNTIITINNDIEAPLPQVWTSYTSPKHITQWNYASEEWHCPTAEVELRSGGLYRARMEAKDGSMGFDFEAVIDEVIPEQKLSYTIGDGRKVNVQMSTLKDKTHVEVTFEAEQINPIEMQEAGWQAILNNFKKYVESLSKRFERLRFSVDVKANANKAYRTMLGMDHLTTYEEWTKLFNPTSTVEGSWEKGSKMYFVGTDEKGNKGGMVSRIVENNPATFVSIMHYGLIQGDQEITEGADVESWAGGLENYTFTQKGDVTNILVEVDMSPTHKDYFNDVYPKALARLKEIIES